MNNEALQRKSKMWMARKTTLLVIGILMALVSIAAASTQSFQLTQEGVAELSKGSYEAALSKFQQAEKADPKDSQAVFFEGVTLNRLGRHAAALSELNQATQLGNRHPDMAFETGWALLGLKRYQEAATALEQYEAAHPGRGQTSEFLGRAYLGMKDYDRAQASFDEAIKRDPSLTPTVRFYQAMMAEERNQPEEASRSIAALVSESPDSPIGQLLRSHAATGTGLGQRRGGKPYSIAGSLGLGYNSNVLFEGETGSDESSFFTRATLDADYVWNRDNGDSITAGYNFLGNIYFSESDGNLLDNFLYGTYRHAFNDRWSGSFRVSDQATFLGGDFFRNTIALRPAVGYSHGSDSFTELAYSLAFSDYHENPALEDLDRDSKTHTLSLAHYFGLKKLKSQARVGVFGVKNQAEGDDFDYDGLGFFIGLRRALGGKWTGDIFYSKSWNNYDDGNIFSGPFSPVKREDRPDYLAIQVLRPLHNDMDLYIRYTYNAANSNIDFFDYKQHTIGAGVNKAF